MEALYRISGERLKGFADQARRLGKISGPLTPAQTEEALAGVRGVASLFDATVTDEIANHVVSASCFADIAQAGLEDISTPATLSGPMCYYNDAILPGIPAEMLEEYPCVFIRKNNNDKTYELGFSKMGFFVDNSPAVRVIDLGIMPRYSFPADFTTETAWTNTYNVHYTGWTIDDNRIPLWANCDIPNGSADSAEIYLSGTAPELLGKFLYEGVLLPGIDRNVLASYPYAWIRKDTNAGYYELFLATGKWYKWVNESGSIVFGHEDSNDIKWYRIVLASAESAGAWAYYQDYSANNFGARTESRSVVWSSHDIPDGSADATEIYFEGSEPVPAE